jgi:hypothetical protein
MATVVLRKVESTFPVGTTVGCFLRAKGCHEVGAQGPQITSAAVAADGSLTFTNAGITADNGLGYVASATVGGIKRYMGFSADQRTSWAGAH